MSQIFFSRGRDKFDNCPQQQSVPDFDTFASLVDQDRSIALNGNVLPGLHILCRVHNRAGVLAPGIIARDEGVAHTPHGGQNGG